MFVFRAERSGKVRSSFVPSSVPPCNPHLSTTASSSHSVPPCAPHPSSASASASSTSTFSFAALSASLSSLTVAPVTDVTPAAVTAAATASCGTNHLEHVNAQLRAIDAYIRVTHFFFLRRFFLCAAICAFLRIFFPPPLVLLHVPSSRFFLNQHSPVLFVSFPAQEGHVSHASALMTALVSSRPRALLETCALYWTSRATLARAQESVHVSEHVTDRTPLQWLCAAFAQRPPPQVNENAKTEFSASRPLSVCLSLCLYDCDKRSRVHRKGEEKKRTNVPYSGGIDLFSSVS